MVVLQHAKRIISPPQYPLPAGRVIRREKAPYTYHGAWTAEKIDQGHWLFTWVGFTGYKYYIWLDGELLDMVTDTEYDFAQNGYDDAPPPIEIVFDTDAENDIYPPFAFLQWREVDGADSYLIEEYVVDTWISRKYIDDIAAGYYQYKSPVLDDQTETKYRVSALDAKGNAGTPVSFTFEIIRNPAPPEVEYEIDGSDDLVVSA